MAHVQNNEKSATGSVLRYVLMPELGRSFSGIGWTVDIFVRSFVTMFLTAGLIPLRHPILRMRRYGMGDFGYAVALALNNVRWTDRRAIPQMILVLATLGLIAFAVMTFIVLAMQMLIGAAVAADPGVSEFSLNLFSLSDPVHDEAQTWIADLFGLHREGTLTLSDGQAGFNRMLGIYSSGVLVLASIIVCYSIISIIIDTAHQGMMFGKKHNEVWAPIRMVAAVTLLVPLAGGYNTGQYAVIKVAQWGSALATNMWTQYLDEVVDGGPPLVAPPVPDASGLVGQLVAIETCRAVMNANKNARTDASDILGRMIGTTAANVKAGWTIWSNKEESDKLSEEFTNEGIRSQKEIASRVGKGDIIGAARGKLAFETGKFVSGTGLLLGMAGGGIKSAIVNIGPVLGFGNTDDLKKVGNVMKGSSGKVVKLLTKSDDDDIQVTETRRDSLFQKALSHNIVVEWEYRSTTADPKEYACGGIKFTVPKSADSGHRSGKVDTMFEGKNKDKFGIKGAAKLFQSEVKASDTIIGAHKEALMKILGHITPLAERYAEMYDPKSSNYQKPVENVGELDALYNSSPDIVKYKLNGVEKPYYDDLLILTYENYIYESILGVAEEITEGFRDNIRNRIENFGWASAAIYYSDIARINGRYFIAAKSMPQVIGPNQDSLESIKNAWYAHFGATLEWSKMRARHGDVNPLKSLGSAGGATPSQMPGLFEIISTAIWYNPSKELNVMFTSENPLSEMVQFGYMLNNAALATVAVGVMMAVIESAGEASGEIMKRIDGPAKANPALGLLGGAFSGGITFLASIAEYLVLISMFIAIILFSAGATLAYLLPLLPAIRFVFGIVSWLVGLFEAVIAIPVLVLAHLRSDGDGIMGPVAQTGYMIIL
ncbi:MAG: DotA/TraY family protein, partial [Pseudomonadota bacterium]|nr:DotA/TraY family protein [Pseudomonadota bacterium]